MISISHLFKSLYRSDEFYILIEINAEDFKLYGLDRILEGNWKPSGISDFWCRVDAENPQLKILRHVAVAHKKHIREKNKQVSWNQNGSRHDKKNFCQSIKGLKTAKDIARRALGLSDNTILEEMATSNELTLLLESNELVLPPDAIYLRMGPYRDSEIDYDAIEQDLKNLSRA